MSHIDRDQQIIEQLTARVAELEKEVKDLESDEYNLLAEFDEILDCPDKQPMSIGLLVVTTTKQRMAENARLRAVIEDSLPFIEAFPATNAHVLADAKAILSTAPAEAQDDPIPASSMYYIQNKGYVGNCLLWWREGGNGYTCDLSEAWRLPEEKANDICKSRPEEDIPHPVDLVNSIAVRHVSCEQFRVALAAAREALKKK